MESKGFLGIDVSKGYADFVLINEKGRVLEKDFQLIDNHIGHQSLVKLIEDWKKQGLKKLYCGVESTGGYENNWHSILKGIQSTGGVSACRLNPKAVKAVSDAELRRTITDSVSAMDIALYLAKFPEKVDYGLNNTYSTKFKEGRDHLTGIRMHIKQKTQLLNQLEKWLYGSFPEVLVYCKNGFPNWLLNMLVDYPTAKKVAMSRGGVSKIKGISSEKETKLIAKAKQNSQEVSAEKAHLISITAEEILHKAKMIDREEAYLTAIYKDNSQVNLLTTIPGVAVRSAVKIILEIEDVNRFASVKKMASYFGLHPTFKQSGDGKWGNYMSKKGRSTMRSTLYMCALSGMQFNPVLKPIYERFRANGMKHNQAIGVLMHKLLRIIFGMLKSNKPFDAEIDHKNQKEAQGKRELQKKNLKEKRKQNRRKKHRYQRLEVAGPISGRKAVKIRKQMASQASNEEANTGSPSAKTKL